MSLAPWFEQAVLIALLVIAVIAAAKIVARWPVARRNARKLAQMQAARMADHG